MTRLLDGKAAIVTGGGRGLGLAIAHALAADGASVLLTGRDDARLKAAAAAIETQGGRASCLTCDITEPESPSRIVGEAAARFHRLDVLVNSAGVFIWKKLLEQTREDWQRTIATNLSAPFFMIQEAAKVMIDRGRGGSIINITSIHAHSPEANLAPHCASKYGLAGLTQSAAEALREFDIRVNAVAPGAIEPDTPARRGESPRKKVTQADVASLVAYLASDLSRSITGATIGAYGGTRTVIKA